MEQKNINKKDNNKTKYNSDFFFWYDMVESIKKIATWVKFSAIVTSVSWMFYVIILVFSLLG